MEGMGETKRDPSQRNAATVSARPVDRLPNVIRVCWGGGGEWKRGLAQTSGATCWLAPRNRDDKVTADVRWIVRAQRR